MKINNPRISLGEVTELKGFFLGHKELKKEHNIASTQTER